VSRPLAPEPVKDLESIRPEWTDLAAGTKNVFATWEWTSTWWRCFGRGRTLCATACRAEDGRLAAILPLYVWRDRPLRVARFLGHQAGDQLGPICAPTERDEAAEALRQTLAATHADVLVGEQLAASDGWSGRLGAAVLNREGSPVLNLANSSWDEYLAGRSRNFRDQVKRRERKLVREHELRFRLADDPARLPADLDLLFRLHRDRWRGVKTNFSDREAFHREFALEAFRRGWLRLWFAELDGECAAAWYGFRFSGIESYYQAGRAVGWEHASVGFVLLAHSIRQAFQDGMQEYRFLRGGEEYKYRFADSDPGLETIALTRGRLGRLAVRGGTVLRRWRSLRSRRVSRRTA
jgi:CelD/BcsL family acetyltransferase involved in cellulose biosynthesis